MAGLLGWKDILRPIRDGYRHLFPTPDTGPSPEERRKRREQDRRKGFAYFDTFGQLEAWDMNESDPLQRANTPLLPRCNGSNFTQKGKSNVLLCHDYAGNYHDYESVQELGQNDEMYTCEYLQYVDMFVYFSHKLVCVPPPTWTNVLHRNGVKALGTILIEPQTKETERLLIRTGTGDNVVFTMAKILANIARHYGFDGFLINIEKPFPKDGWTLEVLLAFLVQLRNELSDQMHLVWYDALTTSNEVQYQNGLNASNLCFAEACGRVLTNYCWRESQASNSNHVAEESGFPSENVHFGIDVWAQNNTGFTHPRSTYPKKGGGGTNTGIAVAKLAQMGLSAGVFAPAWSFEHFPGRGRELERVMWEGAALSSDINCSCGDALSRHQPTQGFTMTQHARLFPAGSESFFYTNFDRAFAIHAGGEEPKGEAFDDSVLHTQPGVQSILPLPTLSIERPRFSHRLENSTHQSKLIVEAHQEIVSAICWLPLYKLNMPANGSLQLAVTCRNLWPVEGALSIYLKFLDYQEPQLVPIDMAESICTIKAVVGKSPHSDIRIDELGFHFDGSCGGEETMAVLEIYSISIIPLQHSQNSDMHTIHGARLERCGDGENKHIRLHWKCTDNAAVRVRGLPYSEITGPFSHFVVRLAGIRVGSVYGLECIIGKGFVKMPESKEVVAEITGIGFDGQRLACQTTTLRIPTE